MRVLSRALSCLAVLLFFLGTMLILGYFWTTRRFETATFDMIVIHLFMPLQGVDRRILISFGLTVFVVFILTFIFGIIMKRTYAAERLGRMKTAYARRLSMVFSCLVFLIGLYQWEARYSVGELLLPAESFNSYIEDNYFAPDSAAITFPDGRNNLIVVILESAETTFNEERLVGARLLPRLYELQKQGTAFSSQRQVVGTECSATSFHALMLGVPLRATLGIREKLDIFLGKATHEDFEPEIKGPRDLREYSVIGLLEKKGYAISLIRAASATFGAYDSFVRCATDNAVVHDFDYFLKNKEEVAERQNGWGVNDSYLFAQAKEHLSSTWQKGPFAMVIQTVNTHLPMHFEEGLPRPFQDDRDGFVQADILASDFIEWIQAQPFGENTTIVVVGDHLLGEMSLGGFKLPDMDDRSIMMFILNSKTVPVKGKETRIYATFDLAPTLLEAVGARFPQRKLGLGTSLFSLERNLLEKDGVKKYTRKIRARSRFSEGRFGI